MACQNKTPSRFSEVSISRFKRKKTQRRKELGCHEGDKWPITQSCLFIPRSQDPVLADLEQLPLGRKRLMALLALFPNSSLHVGPLVSNFHRLSLISLSKGLSQDYWLWFGFFSKISMSPNANSLKRLVRGAFF